MEVFMTHSERAKWLFRLLILCLFSTLILPSAKVANWLEWEDGLRVICFLMGFWGSAITFVCLLVAIFGQDKKVDEEEKEGAAS